MVLVCAVIREVELDPGGNGLPAGGGWSLAFMSRPLTGYLALGVLGAILLLGRLLSVGGPLAAVGAAWRRVHTSRLAANTHVCVQIQRLRNPALDVAAAAFGFCAEEDFYMVLAPILWWILPHYQPFFYNLMLVTLFGLLIGDALKDLLHVPRPSHPQLWTHSHSKGTAQEYGMPSTHSMNAVSNSLVFLSCAGGECAGQTAAGVERGTVALLAMGWVVGICASRLYLGVHTLDDIVVGCGPPPHLHLPTYSPT